MKVLNVDLSFMAEALNGKGINAKPKVIHKMGISRRKKQITAEIKEFQDGLTPSDEYKEFVTELEDLKKKYADVDDKGKMIEQEIPTRKGQVVKVPLVKERLDDYMAKVVALRKKYSVAIDEFRKLNDSYDELLLEEADIKLAYIDLNDFVKEKTSYQELFGLYPIIRNPEKDKILKPAKEVEFKVSDIIGYSEDDTNGLADISKLTAFNDLVFWELGLIVAYNLRSIRSTAIKLNNDKKFIDHKVKYEGERIKLCEVYAKKNINGDAMKGQDGYIIENISTFNKKFEELKSKKKKIISDYEDFLESKVKVKIVPINKNLLEEIDKLLESEDISISLAQAEILDCFA